LQAGWTILTTEQARQSFEKPASNLMNVPVLQGSGSIQDPQFG
jgi:hypothetical protein